MRNRFLTTFALVLLAGGCATGGSGLSPSGGAGSGTAPPPPLLDRDCKAIQPSHTPACERVRAQVADLEDQIQSLKRSLEGPPRPTGPERASIMQSISDLERQKSALGAQVAACDGRNVPRRPRSPDLPGAFLTQLDPAGPPALGTLVVAPVRPDLPPDGVLKQVLTGRELILTFTDSGCRVTVDRIPTGQFKVTGVPRDFRLGAVGSASHGTFHPVSGELDLHIETTLTSDRSSPDPITLDLTTHPPVSSGVSGSNVDANGNVRLVTAFPVSLVFGGSVMAATGVETVSFTFEGKLSARPAP